MLFSYRDSRFKHDAPGSWVIVSVRFVLPWRPVLAYPDLQRHERLSRTASPTARDIFDAVCEIRRAKLPDPAVTGNAGSFFKNPIVSRRGDDWRAFPAWFPTRSPMAATSWQLAG